MGRDTPIGMKRDDEQRQPREFRDWEQILDRAPRMLMVEDDGCIRAPVQEWFELYDWEVTTAVDGTALFDEVEAALSARIPNLRFDVVLTDISMPGIDVLEVLEGLRKTDVEIPVVVISGLPDPNLPRQIRALGRAEMFTKPFVLSEVHHAIDELMECALEDRIIH